MYLLTLSPKAELRMTTCMKRKCKLKEEFIKKIYTHNKVKDKQTYKLQQQRQLKAEGR